MATVAFASQNFSLNDDESHPRDASFSSYLSGGEEALIRKLGKSTSTSTASVAAAPYKFFGRKYSEDGELDIFGAEKYFSGVIDEMETTNGEKGMKQQPNKHVKVDLPRPRKAFKSATPRAYSEASWNSQSALLQKDHHRSPNMQKQMNGNRFFVSFSCRHCASRKSVGIAKNVEKNSASANPSHDQCKKNMVGLREQLHSPVMLANGRLVDLGKTTVSTIVAAGNKQFRPGNFHRGEETDRRIAEDKAIVSFRREGRFTFPNSKSVVGNNLSLRKHEFEEEKARVSLEVFGSSYMVKEDMDMGSSLHRKLAMLLPRDTGRQLIEDFPASSVGMDNGDLDSDSSSDLFEIESFSSKAPHPFFHPPGPDDMSSCYEPSEASIEWSVVTASAANFSVASEYDSERPTEEIITTASSTATKTAAAAKAQRRQPTSLLGCRNAKAVTVAANAQRVSEKSGPALGGEAQSDSMMPPVKFQADHRVAELESAQAQLAFAKNSIPPRSYRSHIPRSQLDMH